MRLASLLTIIALLVSVSTAQADIYGLTEGTPDIQSAGPMTFGPSGILFIGDPMGAAVFAIQTGDKRGEASAVTHDIEGLKKELETVLKSPASSINIDDLAVNPESGNAYLMVSVGGKKPTLVKLGDKSIEEVSLKNVAFAKKAIEDAPDDALVGEGRRRRNLRGETITDIAFVDGEIIVSGLRKGDSPSSVRAFVFPFSKVDHGSSLEIFHGAHGRSEDYSAIRTFVPFVINGEPNLLAGFVCTPLVKFPVSAVKSDSKIEGTTIAELGNRNRPIDMIVYEQNGKNFLLLTNSARGVMKISTDDIEREEGITERVSGGGTAGQQYKTIDSWKNVTQMDKLDGKRAVVLIEDGDNVHLKTKQLP